MLARFGKSILKSAVRVNPICPTAVRFFGTEYTVENPPLPFPKDMADSVKTWAIGSLNHKRNLLSRAVTLLESSLPAHVAQAELLLDYVLSVKRMENERDHPHQFVPARSVWVLLDPQALARVPSARLWERS